MKWDPQWIASLSVAACYIAQKWLLPIIASMSSDIEFLSAHTWVLLLSCLEGGSFLSVQFSNSSFLLAMYFQYLHLIWSRFFGVPFVLGFMKCPFALRFLGWEGEGERERERLWLTSDEDSESPPSLSFELAAAKLTDPNTENTYGTLCDVYDKINAFDNQHFLSKVN